MHTELYLEVKTQFRIDTATQACTWTTLQLPLHVHVLHVCVHVCIQKVFCGGVKSLQSALQNAAGLQNVSVGLVKTETFLVWPNEFDS